MLHERRKCFSKQLFSDMIELCECPQKGAFATFWLVIALPFTSVVPCLDLGCLTFLCVPVLKSTLL